jgi:sortase A
VARRGPADDLRGEVERLRGALSQSEQRRRTAERTLASVARQTVGDLAALRATLADVQRRLAAVEEERDRLQAGQGSPPPPPGPGASPPPAATEPPGRGRRRRGLRGFLLAILVVGLLVAVDGVLTIVWQEPVTALMADRAQGKLRNDLEKLHTQLAAAPRTIGETRANRQRRLATTLLGTRDEGDAIGRLEIPRIGLASVLSKGTATGTLKHGPGLYDGTVLPGLAGTVGIAGHRTTYGAPFRRINELRAGNRIVVRMPYGRFTYVVTGSRIVSPADASSLRSRPDSERLVLTACHPLYSAAERIVVTARLMRPTTPA